MSVWLVGGLTTGSAEAQLAYDTPIALQSPGYLSEPAVIPKPDAPPLLKFSQDLAAHGLYWRSSIVAELAGNPVGGREQGTTVSPYMTAGFDADLDKILGWKGGIFHLTMIGEKSAGTSAEYIGGGIDVQENYAPFDLVRFLNLTIEQRFTLFHEDDLNIIAGRMGATPYFAQNEYTCMFMNHAFCGVLYGFTQSTGTAVAPVSSWGGRVRFNVDHRNYLQAGAFAVDPAAFDASTRLFNFGTSAITGTNYLFEV